MMLAKETDLFKAEAQFQDLIDFVDDCVRHEERIDRAERGLLDRLLKLGHTLLERFVAGHGSGDMGETLDVDDQKYKRLEATHHRRYVSIFGELKIDRVVYGTRETQKLQAVPLDAVLGLPESDFSHVLQDWLQQFCVKDSYAESVGALAGLLNLKVSVGAAEDINAQMAKHGEEYRFDQAPPPPEEEGELFVVTADGKGVVMRKPDQPEQPKAKSAETDGKKGTKRMAYVGAVYSVDRFIRTAEDVMDELKRRQRAAERPQPVGKRLWAEMTRLGEEEELITGRTVLFGQMAEELTPRNLDMAKPVVCLMDGERALWLAKETFFAESVVEILDLFHASQRLWNAAHVFHERGSTKAQQFVDARLLMLLEGKVGRVIGGLRQMLTKHALTSKRRKELQKVITYFDNNRERMRYNEYLAQGYPIGSGVAEGACRHLVKDRMEGTGMRWRHEPAQAMLHLRAIYLNKDWDDFIEHRIQYEQQELYGALAA